MCVYTYPKARAVKAQETIANEEAAAKLSPRQARRCVSPENREQAPTTPANSANINMKLVDGFPPKSAIINTKYKIPISQKTTTYIYVYIYIYIYRERERVGIRGWFCSPLMYLSRDHPASPITTK